MNVSASSLLRVSRWMAAAPPLATLFVAGCGSMSAVYASGAAHVSMSAAPDIILADGKSQTTISVNIRDGNGHSVPDGTRVRFTTSLGVLDTDTVSTASGIARVKLTSASSEGNATVSATSFGLSDNSSATNSTHVEFTSDRDAVFNVGQAGWIRIECPQYLVYSADNKIVEAQGRHGSVKLQYKTLQITADSLQLDLQSQQILAKNAVLTRGHHTVSAVQLSYDLASGVGKAILTGTAKTAAEAVTITGHDFEVAPQTTAAVLEADDPDLYRFVDISEGRVVVSARAIAVDPAGQVQFRRAAIYSDGKKILAVPFHVMPVETDQIFGQQVIGFGSLGFFVNIPYYYHVTPGSTGTLFLRNSAAAGADYTSSSSGSFSNSLVQRRGVSLDLEHTYSIGHGITGGFSVNGLARHDWGAHWNHNQRINEATNTYFTLDMPDHRGFFGSSNVSRQFSGFSFNVSASASHNPGFAGSSGYSSSSTSVSTYIQTNSHQIGQSGLNYVTTFSAQNGKYTQSSPNAATTSTPVETYGTDIRFFTAPIHIGAASLSNGLTLGKNWDQHTGKSRPTVLGTLGLTRPMKWHGQLGLNYTYRYDPLYTQIAVASSTDQLGTLNRQATQQRLSLNYSASPTQKLSFGLSAGYGLPFHDSNLFTNLSYRVSDDWGLSLNSSLDRYLDRSYHDTELAVSRRFFGRYLVVGYSTQTKKMRFDLSGTGF